MPERPESSSVSAPEPASGAPGRTRRAVGMLLRIAGTVALMALTLRNVDWPRLLELLETVDWRWWGAALALGLVVQCLAAIRWAVLARPIGFNYPLTVFIRRFFEGQFFSLCLPTSIGGDVVKAYRLASTTRGRVLAGCTVLADRLAGLAALGVIAITALISNQASLSLLPTLLVGATLLAAVLLPASLIVGHLDTLARFLPSNPGLQGVVAGLLPYQQRPTLIVSAITWSLLVQMGGAMVVDAVGKSLGTDLPVSFWFAAVPLVALAMVLPISISGVGIREGGLAVLLAPYGVPTEKAVAIGLLWFLVTIVCGLVGGVMFLADRHPSSALDGPGGSQSPGTDDAATGP
jgi:uncharacterized protein (TIRG00374 family)